jgi:hypothetical protein
MLKKLDILLLILVSTVTLQAKDYEVDRNGNVNVNVIDRQVIVNGKVVRTLGKGERIKINRNGVKASVGADDVKIENLDEILKKAEKVRRAKGTKGERDFFNGDSFFK